uniref:Uncharacterized protein n=1 Tax=Setaria viridis TaxID=4556 RepID=A0A4U6SPD0_SETVI|nr:hypothetical protein SEVIR_9G029700v2 [Setaria viridis]
MLRPCRVGGGLRSLLLLLLFTVLLSVATFSLHSPDPLVVIDAPPWKPQLIRPRVGTERALAVVVHRAAGRLVGARGGGGGSETLFHWKSIRWAVRPLGSNRERFRALILPGGATAASWSERHCAVDGREAEELMETTKDRIEPARRRSPVASRGRNNF